MATLASSDQLGCLMNIDQIFSAFDQKQDVYYLVVPNAWAQGRTVFGGMSAALAYQAAENLIEDEREVRAFHCNFIGPLETDSELQVSAEILRTGKNVTQIVAKVEQKGRVGVMVQVCFGVSRDSKLKQTAADSHDMTVPKKAKFIPKIPKVVPNFIQHFDLSLDKGDFSFRKNSEAILHGWSRLKKAPEKMRMAYLIAIMDAWPPTMFQMLRLPAPASTMSWDLEFVNPKVDISPDAWIASHTDARHIKDGYGHEEANFWDEKGELFAISRQVVTVFA